MRCAAIEALPQPMRTVPPPIVAQYWPLVTPELEGLPWPMFQPLSPIERSPFVTRFGPEEPPPAPVVPPEPVVEPTTTHLLMSSAQARPGLQALPAMHEHSSSPGVQFDAPPLPPPLPPVPVLGWPHDTATSPQAATVKTEILKKLEA